MDKNSGAKKNIIKLILDICVFIGFLLALDPRSTGIAIHEWLTIAGSAAIILHLLLNWNWIAGMTSRFFRKVAPKARLNYILNWLFFIDGVVVMLSGFLISKIALPAVGIHPQESSGWSQIHSLSADLSLIILALHTALNWDWIVNVVKRYLLQRLPRLGAKRQAASRQEEVQA
jgi:p-aminobenzoyl-glutamate transporter AbgT